jgi:hypothetical protein
LMAKALNKPPVLELDAERLRLAEAYAQTKPWHRWGPYLSERQWGTVREDYSADGAAWDSFPHDHARSRTYRWGEDGLLGICDEACWLCFSLALWNETDPILKERLFGLTGSEGNHGTEKAVNPDGVGTKVAAHYRFVVAPGASEKVMLGLSTTRHDAPFARAEELFETRQAEADSFYMTCGTKNLSEDARSVHRQVFAGLFQTEGR